MDEYEETALAPGTCHHTVLYSSAGLAPIHVPASFGDLYGGAEFLPLVECCEWQETDQGSWSLKGTPSEWPLARGGPPVEYFAPPEGSRSRLESVQCCSVIATSLKVALVVN